jgi:uncharacterized protein YqeY
MLEQQLEADIKAALLGGDKEKALTLRTLKSVLLSAKVQQGKRDSGLTDDEVLSIFGKESKKRQESADFFVQGGAQDRADNELREKAVINAYLPAQLGEAEVAALITEVISANADAGMGQVIGMVRAKAGPTADGALIARLVKEKLA